MDSSRLQQAGGAEHLKTGPGLSPAVTVFFPPTAPLSSAPLDPKVAALTQQLDSLDQDLARAEESMQKRLRSPLSRTDPVSDLLKRLKEQEVLPRLSNPENGPHTELDGDPLDLPTAWSLKL